ncbi:MAG: ferritin-like domain-containing protein [Pseudomonadota bacterium]
MTISNLKDVYIDQLQDLYSACEQSEPMTRKLAAVSKSSYLKQALEDGADGIADGKRAVAKLIEGHGAKPSGEFCKGMEGLVKEAKAHGLDADFSDDDSRDAMIITQYQRMVHYGIAGWGCLVAFAGRLGLDEERDVLQKCLDDTYGGDKRMSAIAMGEVNKKAA